MKKLIFVFGLLVGLSSFAQENEVKKTQEEPEYTSDRIIFKEDANTLVLNGNVDFKTDIIEIFNAENIVFNRSTNEIVVTGLKDFIMDGTIEVTDKAEKQTLRYTLGEKIVYVE